MEIIIIASENVHLEDIEKAFQDNRTKAIEQKRTSYLSTKILPASNCRINDKHIMFIRKEEIC